MKAYTNRTEQFGSDLNWGQWGERTMWPWLEKFFSNGDRQLSYWYDSEYEFRALKGMDKKRRMKEYDLKFGLYYGKKIFCEKEVKFEIKTDKYADTGNLVFEIKDKDRESGVFATTADYFVYFMPRFMKRNIYIIKCDKLKALLSEERWKQYYNYGGDLNKTLNIVVPKIEFEDFFVACGGRIETMLDYSIPEEFGLGMFAEKGKTVYHGSTIKKYDDDLEF